MGTRMTHPRSRRLFSPSLILMLATTLALSACVVAPPQRVVVRDPVVPNPNRIVVYPARGQTAQQMDRDRYECHVWAVMQAGFDPSQPGVPPGERVVVQPATPPGANTAVGAIAGAILGAAIAGPRNAGAGLLLGGVTGAAIGASSDAAAQEQAQAEQRSVNRSYAQNRQGVINYRRAIEACLHGRGYTTG